MEDLTCDADKDMGSAALDVFFNTSKHSSYKEMKTIPFFTSKRWGDRDTIVALLGVDPLRLQHMPVRVRSSKDFCLLAVRKNGLAIQYVAHLAAEDTCEIVEAALKTTPESFPFAVFLLQRTFGGLRNDRINDIGTSWTAQHTKTADKGHLTSVLVVLAMVQAVPHGRIPTFETFKRYMKIALKATPSAAKCFRTWRGEEEELDIEFYQEMLRINGLAMHFIDRFLLFNYARRDSHNFSIADHTAWVETVREDVRMWQVNRRQDIRRWVRLDGELISSVLDDTIKNECMMDAIQTWPHAVQYCVRDQEGPFRRVHNLTMDEFAFFKAAIERDHSTLFYLPDSTWERQDNAFREFILSLFSTNGMILQDDGIRILVAGRRRYKVDMRAKRSQEQRPCPPIR